MDHLAREISPQGHVGLPPPEPGGREVLAAALRAEAAALAERTSSPEMRAETVRAVDGFLASAVRLNQAVACVSDPWCNLVLGGWVAAGVVALGLLLALGRAGPATRIGLAVALVVVVLALERREPALMGGYLLSSLHLDSVFYVIAD